MSSDTASSYLCHNPQVHRIAPAQSVRPTLLKANSRMSTLTSKEDVERANALSGRNMKWTAPIDLPASSEANLRGPKVRDRLLSLPIRRAQLTGKASLQASISRTSSRRRSNIGPLQVEKALVLIPQISAPLRPEGAGVLVAF